MTDRHPDHDSLVALALQDVDPAGRAHLSGHLAACPACRAEYAVIEDAVAQALVAAPAVAPPAGFSGRVLTAMGLEAPSGARASHAPAPPRAWWRTPWLAAAALVAGLVLGVAGTLLVIGPPAPPPAAVSVPGEVTTASPLVTRTGDTVGTAGRTVLLGRDHLVITVTSARPGATYDCVVVGQDGQRRTAGTWTLDASYGAERASGTWVVEVPDGGLDRVELVAPSGTTWAQAQF